MDSSFQARLHMIRAIALNIVELAIVDGDIQRIHEVRNRPLEQMLGVEEAHSILSEVYEKILYQYDGDDWGLLAEYYDAIRTRIGDGQVVEYLMQLITEKLASGPPRIVTLHDLHTYPIIDVFNEAALDRLPRKRLQAGMFGTDHDEIVCPICMERIELGATVIQLECGHWYHPLCTTDWLRMENSCPSCRQVVPLR